MKGKKLVEWKKVIFLVSLFILSYLALFPESCPLLDTKLKNDVKVVTDQTEGFFVSDVFDTGSMRPLIPPGGARAIIKRVEGIDELHPGNILVFYPEWRNAGLMHRLIAITGETLSLKGDSSNEIQLVDFKNGTIFKVYALVSLNEE